MQIVGFLVAALALVCFANAQIFPGNATQLTIGTSFSSTFTPQLLSTNSLIPDLYYIYVPENANSINVTLSTPAGTPCTYTDLFVSPDGFSTTSGAFQGSATFVSYHGSYNAYTGSSGSSVSVVVYPGDYDQYPGSRGESFTAGGFYYISIARELTSDFNDSCPYTVLAQVGQCPSVNNSIAVGEGSASSTVCTTYTSLPLASNNTFTSNGSVQVYKLVLPQSTGNVHIMVSSNDSAYIYGNNKYAASTSSGSTCYTSTSSGIANIFCTGVQAGNFYIVVEPYSSSYPITGTINITTLVCSGNQVGPYCNDTYFNLNNIITTGVPVNLSLGYQQFAYGYFDVDATTANRYVFVQETGAYYFYFGPNGYPTTSWRYDDIVGFSPISLNNFAGGQYPRYYLGLYCYTSAGCNAQVSVNGTQVSTTGASSSTMAVTGSSSTMAVTGSSSTMAVTGSSSTMAVTGATTSRVTTAQATTARATTGRSSTNALATTAGAAQFVPSLMIVLAIVALMF